MSPNLDWEPAAGYVLCKQLKREDMNTGTSLSMPDSSGKVSDSVGVGEIIKLGTPQSGHWRGEKSDEPDWKGPDLQPGDLIGWQPYTDKILEINMVKYSVVAYKNIMCFKKKAAK